jgi:hypothetical protein
VHICRAIILAHLAQETRINIFGILQYPVLCPHQDIPKEQPGQQIDPYRAKSGTGAAINTGGGIEIIRQFHAVKKFRIDL